MYAATLKRLSVLLILFCTFSMSANMTAFAVDASKPTSNILDGIQFVGETGEEGKKANNPDTISFDPTVRVYYPEICERRDHSEFSRSTEPKSGI